MQQMFRSLPVLLIALVTMIGQPAAAQEREVPYWASLRVDEVNMRVGPSGNFPVKWVYHREGLPVKVVRLMEGWRLVQDPDGAEGWIVARLLSRERTALVIGQLLAPMRAEPGDEAQLLWNVEPGVVGVLGECTARWCEYDVNGHRGWIGRERLWGAGAP